MPATKAQLDKALDLFERFVEAHETIAHAAVILTTPNVVAGTKPAASIPLDLGVGSESVSEPAPAQGVGEDNASDPFSLGGPDPVSIPMDTEDDSTDPLASDDPGLDVSNAKDVAEFRATLGNLLREYGKAVGPEMTLDLIEEVCGTRKFSEVTADKLEELHDAVYDALAESE